MSPRRALVVTTAAAAGPRTTGATLRAEEVVATLQEAGYAVERTTGPPSGSYDLAVAVSYACAGSVRSLCRAAPRVWLDAVDSWLLVNGSGLAAGRSSYLLRGVRDAGRLAAMPRAGLVTYISNADRQADRGTVRGEQRLVLPSRLPAPAQEAGDGARRIVLAGDWAYPPNRDGLRWFTEQVLPRLGDAHVVVYGSGAPRDPRVDVRGYAAEPASLYRDGDVHAAPVRFGGGVKRKVLHPLLTGLPVVTTRVGAHGLRPHPLLDVCNKPTGLAAALSRRLSLPVTRRAQGGADLLDADDTDLVLNWLDR